MHRRNNHTLLCSVLIICFLLPACSSAPQSNSSSATTETSAGQGSINETAAFISKCHRVANWIRPFEENYPWLEIAAPRRSFAAMPEMGNLFRDSSFVPFFGFSYSAENADKISKINRDVIQKCRQEGGGASQADWAYLNRLEALFERTFNQFESSIPNLVRDYNQREAWMQNALNEIRQLPLDAAGLYRLNYQIANEGLSRLAPLLPQEQKSFQNAVADKRDEIALRLRGAGTVPGAGAEPTFDPDLERDIARRLSELEQIPLTLEGRTQSRDWFERFAQDFEQFRFAPRMVQAQLAWKAHREKIFQATKPDFISRLDTVKAGEDRSEKFRALLDQTFPLGSDKTMPAYQDYREEILNRERTMLQKFGAKGRAMFRRFHESLTGVARDLVNGADKK